VEIRVVPEDVRCHPLAGGGAHEAREELLAQRLAVDRQVHRPAQALVLERAGLVVDQQALDLGDGRGDDLELVAHEVGRHLRRDLDLAALERCQPYADLLVEAQRDVLDRWLLAPVAVIGGQRDPLAAFPAIELVRSRADHHGVDARVAEVGVLGRRDHHVRRARRRRRVGLVTGDLDCRRVDRLDLRALVHVAAEVLAALVEDPVPAGHDVVRGERLAVVELDALPQVEDPGVAVELPALGQPRRELAALAQHEPLVDAALEELAQAVRVEQRVQAPRLAVDRDRDRAAAAADSPLAGTIVGAVASGASAAGERQGTEPGAERGTEPVTPERHPHSLLLGGEGTDSCQTHTLSSGLR
jgi:hypothetical protein